MVKVLFMDKIPVTFQHDGRQYRGSLDPVFGAGGNTWHLMVDRYYWGCLRLVDNKWYFDENKERVGHLVDYFSDVAIAAGG